MTRITFLHPDLGIGGAERLVVDAATALKRQGHEVSFLTTHHDPDHCFATTKDGTFPVIVVGDWLPRNIFGRFHAFFAYFRMVYAATYLIFSSQRPEVVFCDLVSVCIPILRLRIPYVIYYCHHPDQLLTTPGGFMKQFYRLFLNYAEEITTGMADKIFVNSAYTRTIFRKTFKSLNMEQEILYPSIDTKIFDKARIVDLERVIEQKLPSDSFIILSINRYERKKSLSKALEALAELKKFLTNNEYMNVYLIMAGGYDKILEENVEHYFELVDKAAELEVSDKVFFLRSPTDLEKISLLHHCNLLLYTPVNEHFGIVPLEAMYMEKPVIAHNSGGPIESIINGKSGFLVDHTGNAFAEKIALFVKDRSLCKKFGEIGRKRFIDTFSFNAFTNQLNEAVDNLIRNKKPKSYWSLAWDRFYPKQE